MAWLGRLHAGSLTERDYDFDGGEASLAHGPRNFSVRQRLVGQLLGLDRLGELLLDHRRGDFDCGHISHLHRLDRLRLCGSGLLADQSQCRLGQHGILAIGGDPLGGMIHAVQDRVTVAGAGHANDHLMDDLDRPTEMSGHDLFRELIRHPAAEAAQVGTDDHLACQLSFLADVTDFDLEAVDTLVVKEPKDHAVTCAVLELEVAEANLNRGIGRHVRERSGDGIAAGHRTFPDLDVFADVHRSLFGRFMFGFEQFAPCFTVSIQAFFQGIQTIVANGVADMLPHRDLLIAPLTGQTRTVLTHHQVVDCDVDVRRLAGELGEFASRSGHQCELVTAVHDAKCCIADCDIVAGGHVAKYQFIHGDRRDGQLDRRLGHTRGEAGDRPFDLHRSRLFLCHRLLRLIVLLLGAVGLI